MKRSDKEIFVADMRDRLQKAQATFLVDYQGLDVKAMNRVRKELRESEIEFLVVKNRLLKLASKETTTSSIEEHFTGPCAIAITYDDIIAPAKVLVDLSKDYEKLEIKRGQMHGQPLDLDAIKRLSRLPGRDALLAQVLSAMQAVPASLVRVLNGVLISFLSVLKAIEAKADGENKNE